MKPTIRELRPSDMDMYVDLCESRPHLDRRAAERRAEVVEWMAFHNPHADGNPTYFVIERDDRLVGHLGRMPTRFYVDSEPVQASYIHDLYVRDELVKNGQAFFLSMQMYRNAEQASHGFCALVWTNDINIRMQQARKYHQMWARRHVKLLRADIHIEKHLSQRLGQRLELTRLGNLIGKPVAALLLGAADRALAAALGARRTLEEIERFDERFDRFAEHAGPHMGISPVKDHRYLNWKYTDRPDLDTVHYAAVDGTGEITGFLVLSVPPSLHRESYILELAVNPEDQQTMLVLVNQAIERCRRAGAFTLMCLATDPRVAAVLEKFLFIARTPLEPLFLAAPERSANPERLEHLEHWHFSFGDSEGTV